MEPLRCYGLFCFVSVSRRLWLCCRLPGGLILHLTHLSSALVDVSRGVVEHTQHRDDAIAGTVGSTNVGITGADVVDGKANSSSMLGDDGAVLQRVVDTADRVLLHCQKEARRHLGVGGTGIEESGGGMGEEPLAHHVVRLQDRGNVVAVNSNRNAHNHVLRTLGNHAVHLEKVRLLQGLEAKIIVFKIPVVDDGRVKDIRMNLDNVVELLRHQGGRLTGLGVHCGW